jgi:hypothetical protein
MPSWSNLIGVAAAITKFVYALALNTLTTPQISSHDVPSAAR